MMQILARRETQSPEQRYQEMRARVSQFKDNLGCEVDEGIFETVVYLNLLDAPTLQSCEGHLDHGVPYPWVTIIDEDLSRLFNQKWMAVCDLERQAREAGTPEAYEHYLSATVLLRLAIAQNIQHSPFHGRLTSLLETFYTHPLLPGSARLLIHPFKSSGVYRIEPGFAEVIDDLPDSLKAGYLERGRAEMQRFTAFLKEQYYANASRETSV